MRDSWRAAGLSGDVLEVLDRWHDRSTALAAAYRSARRAPTHYARLASGEATFDEAIDAERTAPGTPAGRARAEHVYVNAQQALRAQVTRELRALGDRLITDHLRPAHDEIVAEVAELAPLVVGIEDDATAIASSPRACEAWARLIVLVDRRRHLQVVRRRVGSVLPRLRAPHLAEHGDNAYAHPDRVPSRLNRLNPARALVALVESGAEPGFYTTAEVEDRIAERRLGPAAENGWEWAKDDRSRLVPKLKAIPTASPR